MPTREDLKQQRIDAMLARKGLPLHPLVMTDDRQAVISNRIAWFLLKAGISIDTFADLAGRESSTINRYKFGHGTIPKTFVKWWSRVRKVEFFDGEVRITLAMPVRPALNTQLRLPLEVALPKPQVSSTLIEGMTKARKAGP